MKLNQNTIETLKNFAGINTNILIKEGDELSTISTMRNIFAKAKISDQFTNEFGIYDLNEFLSAVSGFSKPELSFLKFVIRKMTHQTLLILLLVKVQRQIILSISK